MINCIVYIHRLEMHYPYIIPNQPSFVFVKSGVEDKIFRPGLSQAEDILVKKNFPWSNIATKYDTCATRANL